MERWLRKFDVLLEPAAKPDRRQAARSLLWFALTCWLVSAALWILVAIGQHLWPMGTVLAIVLTPIVPLLDAVLPLFGVHSILPHISIWIAGGTIAVSWLAIARRASGGARSSGLQPRRRSR